jgi:ribosomal protein S18 acetylase RimI-like enzyme
VLERGLAATPDAAYLHPGDLQWRAFGPHGFPLSELIELWAEGDEVVGFGFLESASGFSYEVLPERRGTDLEWEIIHWGHEGVLKWRTEQGLELLATVEVFADDAVRAEMLGRIGYQRTDTGFVAFKRGLDEIQSPVLSDGWEARGIREVDIDSRATCQYEAFSPGSRTTPETWRWLMANAPAYDTDLDSVVVAPDGRVASAAMAWLDTSNKIGLFEPVATRPAFQQQGLGRAALLRGLRAMREHGMTTAFVGTNRANAAAQALYRGVGFMDRNHGFEYEWRPL